MSKGSKIVHASSVHNPFDVRIFHKECRTLADAGYDVVLVVPHERDETVYGVRIRAVPKPKNRLRRMLCTTWQVFRAAMEGKSPVVHLHDPELLLAGLLLRALGRRVIYDIHEDYVTSIRQKEYLPRWVRAPLAGIWNWAEVAASRPFRIIIAERYYARRFPKGAPILNYPVRRGVGRPAASEGANADRPRVLYTGNVTRDRGALRCAEIAALMEGVEVFVVGRCSNELVEEMRQIAGNGKERLHMEGGDAFVPHERIEAYYAEGGWTAGLAVFPPSPHYMEKELTKLFEYMEAGIPVVCSDFPVWRAIVGETGAGICVDPQDTTALTDAIRYLAEHPEEAARMGRRGQELVRTRYNWDAEAAKLLALYEVLTA